MNPGGLRADMVGTGTAYPEVLSYKQAAEVQPFANTLVNMRLTGAHIKTVLEQQWQRDGSGNVPSAAVPAAGHLEGLHLHLRPGPARGLPDHGDVARTASRSTPPPAYSVTVNSFLASGGDNFRAFNQGTNKRDTGKIDLQAMVDYMAAFADTTPLPVDYTQRAVGVSFPAGAPASYAPGSEVGFDLSSLAFSTAADTKDAEVKVSLGATDLGTFPVNNTIGTAVFDEYGTASVHVTLPGDTPVGEAVLTVTGLTTGTSVRVPVQVAQTTSTVSATADPMVYGTPGSVEVSVAPPNSTGSVEVLNGADVLGQATLTDGAATVTIAGTALQPGSARAHGQVPRGRCPRGVDHHGDGHGGQGRLGHHRDAITPTELKVKKDTSRIAVSVAATGTVPTGTVAAFVGGSQIGSGTLTDGQHRVHRGPVRHGGHQDGHDPVPR